MSKCKHECKCEFKHERNECCPSFSGCGLLLLLLFLFLLLLVFGPVLGALVAALLLAVIYIIFKLFCIC